MRSSIVFLSSIGAAMAMPNAMPALKRSNQECGPDSNCEIVNVNGHEVVRFREGMGPGSEDYANRFGTAEQRAKRDDEEEYETTVTIGKTKLPWGCVDDKSDLSVKDQVGEALHELCLPDACDGGSDKSFDTQWVENKDRNEAKLTITADGEYEYPQEHAYIDAVLAALDDELLEWETKDYTNFGAVYATKDECEGVRAPNFIRITRRKKDGSLAGSISYTAKLEIDDEAEGCLAADVLSTVTGMVSGVGSGFFGIVKTLCES